MHKEDLQKSSVSFRPGNSRPSIPGGGTSGGRCKGNDELLLRVSASPAQSSVIHYNGWWPGTGLIIRIPWMGKGQDETRGLQQPSREFFDLSDPGADGPQALCLYWLFLCLSSSVFFVFFTTLSSVTSLLPRKKLKTRRTLLGKGPCRHHPVSESPKADLKHEKRISRVNRGGIVVFLWSPTRHFYLWDFQGQRLFCVPVAFDEFIFQELSIYSMNPAKLLAFIIT